MTIALLSLEILLLLAIGYFGRKWDVDLVRGTLPPSGRVPVYLRFMRPNAWIVLSTALVLLASPRLTPGLVYVLPAVFFQQAFLFAINDYWDRDVDKLNAFKARRNVLCSGELPLPAAKGVLVTILLLGVLLAIPLGWEAVLLAALFLCLSYAYSSPPFRLKARPVWDLVSHGFTVFSYPFLFATVALGLYSTRNLALYAVFAMISLYIQVGQETRDLEDDAQVETNSVISLGYRKAYLFMAFLLVASFVTSFALVLSGTLSPLYLIIASHCAFHLHDLSRTWGSGKYGRCFQDAWGSFNRKTLVGFFPVLLWWLLV